MTTLLFWTFVALLLTPLLAVARQPQKIYQFPYFMAAVFAIFVLPQAVSLIRFPGAAPEQAIEIVLVVTCLCLGACLAGYRWPMRYPIPSNIISPAVEQNKLFHGGLVFVGCGIGFTYLLSHTVVETSETGGWTGPATIYAFFQQLCYPGFAICLMHVLRRPTLIAVMAVLLAAI